LGRKKEYKSGKTYLLGITGTIAAGKSTAAACFQRLGIPLFDADQAGHEVLETFSVKRILWKKYGPPVFTAESFFFGKKFLGGVDLFKARIDRDQLARLVFAVRGKENPIRDFLEGITHPAIEVLFKQFYRQQEAAGVPFVVLDAPLLFETGWNTWCDGVVCIDADREIRRQRTLERGWPEGELDRREKNQEKPESKRKKADFVLDGGGTEEALFQQVAHVAEQLNCL